MQDFKKSKTNQGKPLLSPAERNEPEHPGPRLSLINSLEGGSFLYPYESLKRFLKTLEIDLEDISRLESDHGNEPGTVIQSLQVLFDGETARCAGIKWATLDHLVEKWLQWPFLAKADMSAQSKCCTARVKPVQRSVLLKSHTGLVKAYGIRGFVKGVEYTLAKSVHYFVYAMLTYRLVEWRKTGSLEFTEFKNLFDNASQKGIDTLIHVLSDPNLGTSWLKVILCTPAFIGVALGFNGMYGSREISARELRRITDQVKNRLGKSGGFCRDTLQEYLPLLFQVCSLSRKLQKLERAIRWDGRLFSKERLKMFNLIHRVAQEGHQMTQLHAMECLAKIAHGIGFKDLPKLQQTGYTKEEILAVLYTKAIALQDLTTLTEAKSSLNSPLRWWQISSQFGQHIAPIPRRIYANYLLWWLGVSTSFVKQKLPFSTLKAAKLALEVYFLTEILKSVITAINCPDKPGFKFADGYADWASDYSLECFNTALQFFRNINPEESVEKFAQRISQYHLTDMKKLDLSNKYLNTTELYILVQAIVQKAHKIEGLNVRSNRFNTFMPGTFIGLSQLQNLDLDTSLLNLPTGAFDGLSQLQSLDLHGNRQLTSLSTGVFRGLSQLQSLNLNFTGLITLPAGVFQGLNQLQRLNLNITGLTALPAGVFQGLSQLQNLDLSSTPLTSLPTGIFKGLSQLQNLKLGWNRQLVTLPPGVFQDLSQLQSLYLNNNDQLTMLPTGVFDGLSQLQSLSLSHTPLTNLSAGIFKNLSHLQSLGLNYISLTSLPAEIFKGLTHLQHLSLEIALTNLPTETFDSLSQLQDLVLNTNKLTTLSVGIFKNLSHLQNLSLSGAQLTSLPVGVFNGLSQLQNLVLYSSPTLITLPVGIFDGLSQLQTLSLSYNYKFTTLPTGIFKGLSQLQRLTLNGIPLTNLSKGIFEGLSQLQTLDFVGGTPSISLPTKVFEDLSQLQTLRLSVPLTSLLVGTFQGLSQLQSLSLSNTQLTSLQVGVFDGLSQLKTLSLSFTPLTNLPIGVFEGLSHLQSLSLSDTQLISLQAGVFDGLSQLQTLSLNYNHKLTALSTEIFKGLNQLWSLSFSSANLPARVFEGLNQLQILNLDTQLTSLPIRIFQNLTRLQILNLGSPLLTSLPAGIFKGLGQLQKLSLGNSLTDNPPLTSLPAGVFDGLTQLQSLDLRDKRFTTLPAGVFDGLTQLQRLYLNAGQLTSLPTGVFEGLNELKILDLSNNPQLTSLPAGVFRSLDQLQNLVLSGNKLNDIAIYNLTQGLSYQLQTLDIRNNYISDLGITPLVKLLPCSNISNFKFIPSHVPLNDTVLSLQQQHKSLERVCADRACHANLPSKSCPPDSFYGRMHPKEVSTSSSALYVPTPFTWVSAASPSLPTLSSSLEVSSHVVIRLGESALVLGSVGLGILFYKNCTLLQSVVHTGWGFVQQCFYGKKEAQPQVIPAESEESSAHAANLGTQTKRSSVSSVFATFFFHKPKANITQINSNPEARQPSMRV